MPSRPSPTRKHARGRPSRKLSRIERVERAVFLLHKRIAKIEGKHKRIGFQTTDARGDGIEQVWSDEDEIPEET